MKISAAHLENQSTRCASRSYLSTFLFCTKNSTSVWTNMLIIRERQRTLIQLTFADCLFFVKVLSVSSCNTIRFGLPLLRAYWAASTSSHSFTKFWHRFADITPWWRAIASLGACYVCVLIRFSAIFLYLWPLDILSVWPATWSGQFLHIMSINLGYLLLVVFLLLATST